jgi:hypothetical protein
MLSAVVGVGLLTGFHQVVAQSVADGEQRRATSDMHDMKLWRCKRLPDTAGRDQCRAQLHASPGTTPSRDLASLVVKPLER